MHSESFCRNILKRQSDCTIVLALMWFLYFCYTSTTVIRDWRCEFNFHDLREDWQTLCYVCRPKNKLVTGGINFSLITGLVKQCIRIRICMNLRAWIICIIQQLMRCGMAEWVYAPNPTNVTTIFIFRPFRLKLIYTPLRHVPFNARVYPYVSPLLHSGRTIARYRSAEPLLNVINKMPERNRPLNTCKLRRRANRAH